MEKMTLSVEETVEISGIGRNKIFDLIKNDPKFPYIKVGTRYKINRQMLQEYLNEATRMNKVLWIPGRSRSVVRCHTTRTKGIGVSKRRNNMGMTIQEQDRRERRREWRKEQLMDSKNEYGISDPTPKIANRNIVNSKMDAVTRTLESESWTISEGWQGNDNEQTGRCKRNSIG